jgi:hypothetical protein
MCPYSSRRVDGACAVTCPMMVRDPVPSQPTICEKDADYDCSSYGAEGMRDYRCNNGECVAVVERESKNAAPEFRSRMKVKGTV